MAIIGGKIPRKDHRRYRELKERLFCETVEELKRLKIEEYFDLKYVRKKAL